MLNKLIKCGFLSKSSGYYYYVQNVILQKTGWIEVQIKNSSNNDIHKYKNIGKEMKIEMTMDNNYNILFLVDGKCIIQSRKLFEVELNVTTESETNFYKFEEGLIVDH